MQIHRQLFCLGRNAQSGSGGLDSLMVDIGADLDARSYVGNAWNLLEVAD